MDQLHQSTKIGLANNNFIYFGGETSFAAAWQLQFVLHGFGPGDQPENHRNSYSTLLGSARLGSNANELAASLFTTGRDNFACR